MSDNGCWMVRLIFLVFPVFFSGLNNNDLLFGQTAPAFLPDDFDFDTEEIGCICTPGVINKSPGKGLLIEYNLSSGGEFTPDEVAVGIAPSKVNNLGKLRLRLKIPVFLKPKTKILLGIDHFREKYQFNFIQPLFAQPLNLVNGTVLKSTRGSAYLLQSFGESNYLGLNARFSWNGNYDDLTSGNPFFRQIRISGVWAIKKREDLEWGLGVMYAQNFNRKALLPFFLYNHTFSERWGLEMAFPVSIMMRYNFSTKNLLLFGPEFGSARYALKGADANGVEDYYFKHTELLLGASWERQLRPWIWSIVHSGIQINFDSEYERISDGSRFAPDLITGIFFRVGLFLSPPKK